MARVKKYIELDGPLFDPDVIKRFKDEVAEGIEEVGDEAAGILAGFTANRGFVRSGMFLRSISSEFVRSGDAIGYAKVAPTAVWPTAARPTRTWAERGVRNGVRLRKGLWLFRNTATRTRQLDFEHMFAERIRRALG